MTTSLLCRDLRLDRAIDRDLRDAERCDLFESVILQAMDAIARDVFPMEHPYRTFSPEDFFDGLKETLDEVRRHRLLTRGSVVVEDDDGV